MDYNPDSCCSSNFDWTISSRSPRFFMVVVQRDGQMTPFEQAVVGLLEEIKALLEEIRGNTY